MPDLIDGHVVHTDDEIAAARTANRESAEARAEQLRRDALTAQARAMRKRAELAARLADDAVPAAPRAGDPSEPARTQGEAR